VRGWVTSFFAEYMGHAPATRAYERAVGHRGSRASGFMVLVFSEAHFYGRLFAIADDAVATAGIFTTTRLIAQLKQSLNAEWKPKLDGFAKVLVRSRTYAECETPKCILSIVSAYLRECAVL